MEITLIRHGRSLWIENMPMTCIEFKKWVENYDCNGVFEEKSYPSVTLEKIGAANIVISSDLKRTVESAKYLRPDIPVISDPLFRETTLPIPLIKLGGIKLKASIWAVIFRSLWFCGYSRGCESLKEAGMRAEKAADFLIKSAKEHNNAVLVGHGFFNMLVGKELKKRGWNGKKKTNFKHWNSITYSIFN
ncbi:Broad specificity phosphatase PhoE [Bacillus sp. OV322]|uniref:histidine phosphatase family protein n=1 Tax=Bacillus sp. OV322 TaxID=1882764 RepID=UPI0008E74268|nr:histidine phosphatase family protein [Bacillus sp. OV322]SFC75773.1 Broad specificity phosphatase PhoE [Bacillus sp. OV322]